MVALIRAMRDHERDPLRFPLPSDPAAALEKIASVLSLSDMRSQLFAVAKQRGMAVKISSPASAADEVELF